MSFKLEKKKMNLHLLRMKTQNTKGKNFKREKITLQIALKVVKMTADLA